MVKTGLILASVIALAGCAQPAPVVTDTSCSSFYPIRVSPLDVLTTGTVQQLLEYNRTLEAKRCKRTDP